MQIEGLNFLKVQKSLRAKTMKKKKYQMKIRVDFQTTKYLVLVCFWERECPPYEQRWRSKYGCIEQYLEDKNEVNVYYNNKKMNSLIKKIRSRKGDFQKIAMVVSFVKYQN